uniref:Uncharacterized protein n=1 Tax=Anopheles arabiensis TaxID=7173 RepID=A0A182HVR1_ANOAR
SFGAEEAVVVNGKNVTKAEAAAQSGRITNSVAVDIAKYPFAQSLRLDGRYRCGAVVISTSHALTGADAVYSFRNSVQRLTLYAGSISPTSRGVSFQVIRIAAHPNYNPNEGVSDFNIVVLTVRTNAFRGKLNIAPIPLASAGVAIGTECSVYGWGSTNLNLVAPVNALRAAGMVITSEATCARVWAQLGVKITSNILCAKGDRAADLCNSDLRNGLVCNGRLAGVAFLFSRCDNVLDTVYMKITAPSVRSFIRSQTGI